MKQSQKLLLTWLIEDTRLFDSIKGWITEEDFTEPLYRKAAQELFTQYGESGQVNPAKIISRFQEEEEQKEIAGLFNAKIHEVETKQDKEKALKETIERIKENSIDVRSRQSDPNDLTVVMQLINEQKELEKLKKRIFLLIRDKIESNLRGRNDMAKKKKRMQQWKRKKQRQSSEKN